MNCKLLVLAALLGAIFWNVTTWKLGLPSSSSHALVGGLIGAGVAYGGWRTLEYASIFWKVIVPIFASPLAGFFVGYLTTLGLAWACVNAKPRPANRVFRRLQIISSSVLGSGSVRNISAVRWGVAGRMVTAWVMTLPAAALVGALMFWLLQFLTGL